VYVGRQLIQRLVTGNPSAAYVSRVAAKFIDNGAGVRGDMAAVVKAILLDVEARGPAKAQADFGSLRESVLMVTALARALNGLGLAYGQRFGESREKNLERAIGCFLGAQEILSALGRDAEYAAAAHNLGWAYIQRIAGNPAENIESALGCLQDALRTRVRLGMAAEAAEARHALGSAYLIRGRGERAQNFELAISEFREAEAAFMSLPSARHVALVQLVLGQAYANRVLGDREDNLRQAVACLKAALTAFADQGMVLEQAGALSGLGNAVAEQNAPDRAAALRSAIGYHRQALAVLSTHGGSPDARARALNNLGTAYLERSSVQEDDLGSAISCFTQSLAAGTAQTSPLEQAQTRYNLGVAHAARAALDHPDDLRDAITQFTAALREFSAIGFAPVFLILLRLPLWPV